MPRRVRLRRCLPALRVLHHAFISARERSMPESLLVPAEAWLSKIPVRQDLSGAPCPATPRVINYLELTRHPALGTAAALHSLHAA